MYQPSSISLEHRDYETQQWTHLTRRRFLKGTLLGSLGATLLGTPPAVLARALLAGKTPAEIRGAGVEPGLVKLNQNENPVGPSPMALDAIRKYLPNLNRYMSNYPTQLVYKLNTMAGVKMEGTGPNPQKDEEWDNFFKYNRIFMADGSGSILKAVALTYLDGGGHLIEAQNGYGDISEFAQDLQRRGRNVTITRVPLDANKRHDLAVMKKAINSETKLIVITNPNNPTSTIVSHEELERFIADVPETVKVLVDEAYIDFVRDPNYRNAMDLAASRSNVLVTRTFSKVYGLPAIRIGYAVGHRDLFEGFWNYTGSWNSLSLEAANAALDDVEHIRISKQTISEGRMYLEKEFASMGIEYTPSESSFMIFKLKDAKKVGAELAKNKVFVRDAERMWGVKDHLRVSIGTRDECEAFITTLRQVLAAGA